MYFKNIKLNSKVKGTVPFPLQYKALVCTSYAPLIKVEISIL